MKKNLEKIKNFLIKEFFVELDVYKTNKKLYKRINYIDVCKIDISDIKKRKYVYYTEQLKNEIKEQFNIKKYLTEKAKILFFITTFIFILITLLTFFINNYTNLSLFFLIVSIFYLFITFLKELEVIYPRKLYYLETYINVFFNVYKVKIYSNDNKTRILKDLIKNKKKNSFILMILANNLLSSTLLLRNSIISLLIFILLNILK